MIFLVCLALAGMMCSAPRAIADALTTARASKAGAWDFLTGDRDRRDARAARRRDTLGSAWRAVRTARHRQAGGSGAYKPGARAYLGDVYTGWWADRLANRKAKREHRGPVTWSPDRPPWHERVDRAVYAGWDRARGAWEGRGNRLATGPDPADAPPGSPPPEPATDPTPEPTPEPTPTPADAPADPARPTIQGDQHPATAHPETTATPTQGDTDMTDTAAQSGTATGDAHDVETALAQCAALDDDLTGINTALDVIDENIDSAGTAAELIESFLASKNVDDTAVGGMSVARDMLSPTHIKALIDAVAAAKQGVAAAHEELLRLQELEQQLNGADGSVLNGR